MLSKITLVSIEEWLVGGEVIKYDTNNYDLIVNREKNFRGAVTNKRTIFVTENRMHDVKNSLVASLSFARKVYLGLLIAGIIILLIALVSVLLIFLKRQRRIRKLHDTYGEYISIIGQKKDAFLKIRKQIHYWDYILDDIFSSNNIRNTLLALETIDHSYILYKIGIYEKLFPLLEIDTKSTMFWALLNFVKGSVQITRELINFKSKPLPFFIHDEINRIYFENKKYIPKYFMQSLTGPNYEVYINSKDYIDVHYGGTLKFIKKYGFKVFANYNQKIKPYEFLLDENLNIVNMRLKSKSRKLIQKGADRMVK